MSLQRPERNLLTLTQLPEQGAPLPVLIPPSGVPFDTVPPTVPSAFLKCAQSLSCALPSKAKFTMASESPREQMCPFLCLGGSDFIPSGLCESLD